MKPEFTVSELLAYSTKLEQTQRSSFRSQINTGRSGLKRYVASFSGFIGAVNRMKTSRRENKSEAPCNTQRRDDEEGTTRNLVCQGIFMEKLFLRSFGFSQELTSALVTMGEPYVKEEVVVEGRLAPMGRNRIPEEMIELGETKIIDTPIKGTSATLKKSSWFKTGKPL
ncbi:hypothetical protein PsorP6_003108 [Peronosclerospora sorghi]|uniref:Uncharacterized protein n=1 Tax=Peronosclerospora sorghi TaxID=230839 RepID=A0ACC0VL02_9STRA|nr:hypothetical protein PsorP6_003108 [Peronosclerospora sorghi]